MTKTDKLKIGKTYRFEHRKKGTFIGQLMAFVPTEKEDIDPCFLRVKVDTRPGTEQHKLAWTDVDFREIDIRPSHVTNFEEVEPDEWLMKQVVKPPVDPYKEHQNYIENIVKVTLNEQKKREQRKPLFQRLKELIKTGGSHG